MHYSTKYGKNCGSNAISYFDPAQWPKQGAGNYQCGNVWDDGARAGSGADQSNTYPEPHETGRVLRRCRYW